MSLHSQHHPTDTGPDARPAATGPAKQHQGHGGHLWHMLLMCLPLIGFGLWSEVRDCFRTRDPHG